MHKGHRKWPSTNSHKTLPKNKPIGPSLLVKTAYNCVYKWAQLCVSAKNRSDKFRLILRTIITS